MFNAFQLCKIFNDAFSLQNFAYLNFIFFLLVLDRPQGPSSVLASEKVNIKQTAWTNIGFTISKVTWLKKSPNFIPFFYQNSLKSIAEAEVPAYLVVLDQLR